MSFVNPMLLAALAAVAIPVLVHLVNREERQGLPFPSLMFLHPVQVTVPRRRTLRDRGLLALRCLGLVLLVLAFAGPRCTAEPGAAGESAAVVDTVVLLDRSYSMQPASRWREATTIASRQLEDAAARGRVALVLFDDRAEVLVPLTHDAGRLRQGLAAALPGASGTDLAAAFELAGELLAGSLATTRRLVLVSDLQRIALDGAGRLQLQHGTELSVASVDSPVGGNAALLSADWRRAVDGSGSLLAIRVANTGDRPLAGVRVGAWSDGVAAGEVDVDLQPGETRELELPLVVPPDRVLSIRLQLGDDAIAADNELHLSLFPGPPIEVSAPTAGPWLRSALAVMRTPAVSIVPDASSSGTEVLVTDPAAVARLERRSSGQGVDRWRGILLTMDGEQHAAAGEGLPGTPPEEAGADLRYAEGAAVRLDEHPAWHGRRAALEETLAGVRLLRVRETVPPGDARVMARLDDGTPWMWSYRSGSREVVVLAVGLSPDWGNLVFDPGFAPLLRQLLLYLAERRPVPISWSSGAVVDVAELSAALPDGSGWREYLDQGGQVMVVAPDGVRRTLPTGESLLQLELPGSYQVHRLDGRARYPLAVNVDRAESDLTAESPDVLRQRVTWRAERAAYRSSRDRPAEPAPTWLLTAALLVLLIEVVVANRTGTRHRGNPISA